MANKEMNVRLKNRRDTLANWETENPVLLSGETAYVVLDGGVRQKTGDGKTAFKSLPYDDADIYQAVSALQTSQNKTASDLSALESEVNTLSTDVATAKSNASSALSGLDGKADASTVTSLQSTVKTLSTDVSSAQAEIDAVEKTVSDHTTSIAALQKAPPAHTHATSDVTGLDATIEGLETDIESAASTAATALATANDKAPSDHTHTPASIGAAPSDHPHSISDVTDLQDALDDKANASTVSSHTANTTVHGTAYTISKGKTLVNGTAYSVSFATTIYFYCMGETYSCESGMTWQQYVDSGGGGRFTIDGEHVCHDNVYVVNSMGEYVYWYDTIIANEDYTWEG